MLGLLIGLHYKGLSTRNLMHIFHLILKCSCGEHLGFSMHEQEITLLYLILILLKNPGIFDNI